MTAYRFVAAEKAHSTVRTICRVIRLSRASNHVWREAQAEPSTDADAVVRGHARGVRRASRGTCGSPRRTAALRTRGLRVKHTRVAPIRCEAGLRGAPRRRFRGTTTDAPHTRPVAPNVIARDFARTAPNASWVADIPCLPVGTGWAWPGVLIERFSRTVVGWARDDPLRTERCLDARKRALALRPSATGRVHPSDRGSPYASCAYVATLVQAGVVQSMSREGNCWDNAVAESFFGTLEQELGTTARWTSVAHARSDGGAGIHGFSDDARPHLTIGLHSPVAFEALHRASITDAA